MSISGRKLTAYFNGVEMNGNQGWDVDETGDKLDATVGRDRGKARTDMGVEETNVTCKGVHDASTGSLAGLRRNSTLTNVELFLDIDDSTPAYTIDEVLVTHFRLGAEVRGRFEWTCEFTAQGDVVTYNDPS